MITIFINLYNGYELDFVKSDDHKKLNEFNFDSSTFIGG